MDTSEHVLVILLSTALAVLLVIAIAISVQAYRLLKTVQRIADKAEHVIQSAEHVGAAFANATGSLAIVRVIKNLVELVTKDKARKHKK